MSEIFKNKWIRWGLIALSVAIVAYLLFRKDVNAYASRTLKGPVGEDEPPTDGQNERTLLKKGMRGRYVGVLQKEIMADGGKLPKFGADGIFGRETEKALMSVMEGMGGIPVKEISLLDYKKNRLTPVIGPVSPPQGGFDGGGILAPPIRDFTEAERN